MKKTAILLWVLCCLMTLNINAALVDPITVHGTQNIYSFLSKKTENKRLMSFQKQNHFLALFFRHFFSPWTTANKTLIHQLKQDELKNIHIYKANPGWGENFHRHNEHWVKQIIANMNISSFPNNNRYAITVDNAYVRVLPTIEPHFYNFRLAGEGYPFDNLQEAVIWAGTPIHVFQISKDGAWVFVHSPAVSGWIQIKNIAIVNSSFMNLWRHKPFAATILDKTAIKGLSGSYRFTAYMGSLFPIDRIDSHHFRIFIPVADLQYHVLVRKSIVSNQQMSLMPLSATPKHFAGLIHQLLGTPYGWGGLYFYDDCSGTLKSLFTPIGIWLPRNSAAQAKIAPQVALNTLSPSEQKAQLDQSKPFLTFIYLPGHIMLYIGKSGSKYVTFQNLWAFVTKNANGVEGRAIVGKAALMEYYPYTTVTYRLIRLVR